MLIPFFVWLLKSNSLELSLSPQLSLGQWTHEHPSDDSAFNRELGSQHFLSLPLNRNHSCHPPHLSPSALSCILNTSRLLSLVLTAVRGLLKQFALPFCSQATRSLPYASVGKPNPIHSTWGPKWWDFCWICTFLSSTQLSSDFLCLLVVSVE